MYVDPSGLSLVVQLGIATLIGAPVMVAIYWKRILAFVFRKRDEKSK